LSIGKRIKSLRHALILTQEQFAGRLKISKGFVSNLEKERVLPSDQLIRLMSYEYSSSEYWLTTGDGEMFLSPEEVVKNQIARLGERAFYEAIRAIADEHALSILAPRSGNRNLDPELCNMQDFLTDIWSLGDDDLKAWAKVQFNRAFPSDVVDDVQKKHAETQGQESTA